MCGSVWRNVCKDLQHSGCVSQRCCDLLALRCAAALVKLSSMHLCIDVHAWMRHALVAPP